MASDILKTSVNLLEIRKVVADAVRNARAATNMIQAVRAEIELIGSTENRPGLQMELDDLTAVLNRYNAMFKERFAMLGVRKIVTSAGVAFLNDKDEVCYNPKGVGVCVKLQ